MIRNCARARLAIGHRRPPTSTATANIASSARHIATSSTRPRSITATATATTTATTTAFRNATANRVAQDTTIFFAFTARRQFHGSAFILAEETVKVPQMAESISEGTLKSWVKKEGDYVEADEEVATIETDKVDVSVNAPKAGTISKTLAAEEDTVSVGQELFIIDTDGKPGGGSGGGGEEKAKAEPKEDKEAKKDEGEGEKKPEPKEEAKEEEKQQPARKEREEVKVQHKEEEPKRDAPKKSEEPKQPKAQPDAGEKQEKTKESGKVTGEGDRTERRVKMNRMRARIAERLKQSQNAAAFLTTFNEIDMSSAMSMRSAYKDKVLKEHGVKLGFMSIFARACAIALKELPAVNASIEGPGAGEQIVYHDYVDLSVAVATTKGLVTPVVRNVEGLGMVEIESAIAELGKKARDNKLTIEDMAGGTFTISNGGVFGSLYGTPIINLPQSAVLGMHAINQKPVAVNGEVIIRPIMVVALTYDHRIIDGREAVTFLVRVKELVEDPRAMLLA